VNFLGYLFCEQQKDKKNKHSAQHARRARVVRHGCKYKPFVLVVTEWTNRLNGLQ